MSEMKEEEEILEHGSGSGSGSLSDSSEGEQMVEAGIELDQPHQQQEEEEYENLSGNSETTSDEDSDEGLDEGYKHVESAEEEAQLNGHHMPNYSAEDFEGGSNVIVGEGDASLPQQEVGGAGGERMSDAKGDENAEESKVMEEGKIVKEFDETKELKAGGTEEVKNEGVPVVQNHSVQEGNGVKEETPLKRETMLMSYSLNAEGSNQSFPTSLNMTDGDDGTPEEQVAFTREVESFFRERGLEFKHPKFYGEGLNCLKLWRAVTKLGGYDRVTACKLWRQVGESFKPPKTCTTVSWSFRIFYEKALLDYERHKTRGGELVIPASPFPEPPRIETLMGSQGPGRARRDAAARAMQGWHSQRLLGNGEVGDPIIKDKSSPSMPKREKHLKGVGLLKRKKPSSLDRSLKAPRTISNVSKPQIDTDVIDIGTPVADWVKINVLRTKDCFEVYALVPGLLREEVRVQSDPVGRLVISGDPEQPDNPWGVTPFKKVITLPSRIDPHQTSAVVTLHGQLFVRVPFEQSDL